MDYVIQVIKLLYAGLIRRERRMSDTILLIRSYSNYRLGRYDHNHDQDSFGDGMNAGSTERLKEEERRKLLLDRATRFQETYPEIFQVFRESPPTFGLCFVEHSDRPTKSFLQLNLDLINATGDKIVSLAFILRQDSGHDCEVSARGWGHHSGHFSDSLNTMDYSVGALYGNLNIARSE
jgi:hypothetical protein